MLFRRKLNYRNITLTSAPSGETVGVLLKNGEFRYCPWLGVLATKQALDKNGIPVKLEIEAYLPDEAGLSWVSLSPGDYIQGCFVDGGVYAVVNKDKPKIVKSSREVNEEN